MAPPGCLGCLLGFTKETSDLFVQRFVALGFSGFSEPPFEGWAKTCPESRKHQGRELLQDAFDATGLRGLRSNRLLSDTYGVKGWKPPKRGKGKGMPKGKQIQEQPKRGIENKELGKATCWEAKPSGFLNSGYREPLLPLVVHRGAMEGLRGRRYLL